MSAHCASSCHVPFVMSRALSQLASLALCCIGQVRPPQNHNQTQRLSAETVGQQSARLTQMRDTSHQRLYVYTLFPYIIPSLFTYNYVFLIHTLLHV